MSQSNGNGAHIGDGLCPICSNRLIVHDTRSETSGMNAVCDLCLVPVLKRIAREIDRTAGRVGVRLLDYEHSAHSNGVFVRLFIAAPVTVG